MSNHNKHFRKLTITFLLTLCLKKLGCPIMKLLAMAALLVKIVSAEISKPRQSMWRLRQLYWGHNLQQNWTVVD